MINDKIAQMIPTEEVEMLVDLGIEKSHFLAYGNDEKCFFIRNQNYYINRGSVYELLKNYDSFGKKINCEFCVTGKDNSTECPEWELQRRLRG